MMRPIVLLSLACVTIAAAADWSAAVQVWEPPFDMSSPRRDVRYEALPEARQKWRLKVSFPHMKDAYWLAVNYGIVDEARRLGVAIDLVQAGGYDNLDKQIAQLREAPEEGTDGVILGAISYSGLDSVVAELKAKGIPVVDVINDMSSPDLAAKSLVSFGDMGRLAGRYLAARHPPGSTAARIAWFPGPEGAGWAQAGDDGFRAAVGEAAIEIVTTRYGDTGRKTQGDLLTEILDDGIELDYIVGTAVTAEVAVTLLRERQLTGRIQVLSYYLTPGVHRGIRRGQILASPTDSAVLQGRIAVDQIVRVLEGKPVLRHVGPRLEMIDGTNIHTFDRSTSLAPNGFRPTYTVN